MGHSLALYENWILSTSEAPSKLGERGEKGGGLGGALSVYHTPGSLPSLLGTTNWFLWVH